MNKYLNTIVVVPMTTDLKKYPTRISVKRNAKNGMVTIDQIRTIDKKNHYAALLNLRSLKILLTFNVSNEEQNY